MIIIKKYWHLILLTLVILLVSWPLFLPGYFPHQDDLQIMRIFEMRKCFTDFQIPCRWVPDMGWGNGYPLFNYYSAFPYYVGGLLSFLLGYIWAAKTVFFLSIVISGISMYFLCRELFDKISAVCAASLYILAPYKALDLYVRGALAESVALALIPLVLYFILKLIKTKKIIYFLGAVFSLGAFLTSHNIMTLFFLPLYFIWCLYWLISLKRNAWLITIFATLLGFGISVFFVIPAYFEKSLVQSDSLISMDFNFRAHFISIEQLLFDKSWGYGTSSLGDSEISSQIGWPYWWLAVFFIFAAIFLIIVQKFKQIINKDKLFIFLFSLIVFCLSVFMMHIRSSFIWEKIHILSYVQFPWRFLSLSIFSSSILGGLLISLFKGKLQFILMFLLISLALVFNWNYFQPKYFDLTATNEQKLTGSEWERQQKAAILDYLPKTSLEPTEKAPSSPIIRSGEGKISFFDNHSNRWQFQANIIKNAVLEIPVLDFPNWQVKVNGKDYPFSHKNITGRIQIELPPGGYSISGQFNDTPVRKISDIITLISLLGIGGFIYYEKNHKLFK